MDSLRMMMDDRHKLKLSSISAQSRLLLTALSNLSKLVRTRYFMRAKLVQTDLIGTPSADPTLAHFRGFDRRLRASCLPQCVLRFWPRDAGRSKHD